MIAGALAIGCTRDAALRQRLDAYIGAMVELTWTDDAAAARFAMENHQMAILLVDLRFPQALELLHLRSESFPGSIAICFGEARSRPALEAERLGLYELLSFEPERRALQRVMGRAVEAAALAADHRLLANRSPELRSSPGDYLSSSQGRGEGLVKGIGKAFRTLDEPAQVFQHLVHLFAHESSSSYLGLFLKDAETGSFSMAASLRTPVAFAELRLPAEHPAIRLMERKSLVLSQRHLRRIPADSDRLALAAFLAKFNSELILPLIGAEGLLGWLAVGGRISGVDYSDRDIEELMLVGQEATSTVEKVLTFKRANLQRNMLQRLFDTLPEALLAVGETGNILWLNSAGEKLFGTSFEQAVGRPVSVIGSELEAFAGEIGVSRLAASRLTRLQGGVPVELRGDVFEAEDGRFAGILITAQDLSSQEQFAKERDLRLRNEILSEMVDHMAFEIRAPLTAIKSFAQLLPARSGDQAFCNKVEQIVCSEVDRLTELSEALCTLGRLRNRSVPPQRAVFSAKDLVDLVRCLSGDYWKTVEAKIGSDVPPLEGNCEKLGEAICHLIANAREASTDKPIAFEVRKSKASPNVEAVEISVTDHREVCSTGCFVDNSSLGSMDTIRRADLRLSFACDIVRDHAGSMELATSSTGVTVRILLPVTS